MKTRKTQPWQIDILKETTPGLPQNVYYVNQNRTKLVAFYPEGDKDAFIKYSVAKSLSTRYLTFEVVAQGLNSL